MYKSKRCQEIEKEMLAAGIELILIDEAIKAQQQEEAKLDQQRLTSIHIEAMKVRDEVSLVTGKEQLKKIEEKKQAQQKVDEYDLFNPNIEDIKKRAAASKLYAERAASPNKLSFIMPSLKDVPFFSGNLILIGAHSGKGKTTTAAQVSCNVLKNNSPLHEGKGNSLWMSNETTADEVYARHFYAYQNKRYVPLPERTKTDRDLIEKFQIVMEKTNRLTVIDNNLSAIEDATTNTRSIIKIIEKTRTNPNHYDVIIIDQFQQIVSTDKKINRACEPLEEFSKEIRKIFPLLNCPVVVLTQLREPDEAYGFHNRMIDSKSLYLPATCVIEVTPNFGKYTTDIKYWKSSRYAPKAQDTTITVGYHRDTELLVELDTIGPLMGQWEWDAMCPEDKEKILSEQNNKTYKGDKDE